MLIKCKHQCVQYWEAASYNSRKRVPRESRDRDNYMPNAKEVTTNSTVQLSSVQDGIHALGKAHMSSTPSLRSFPNVAFETGPMMVRLTMALSRPKDSSLSASPKEEEARGREERGKRGKGRGCCTQNSNPQPLDPESTSRWFSPHGHATWSLFNHFLL